MGEEWRPVVGYEGFYEVSNKGQVRSLPRVVPGRYEGYFYTRPGRVLKPSPNNGGHLGVYLTGACSKKRHLVHRLVAESFIPNPNNHPFVLHWDDNPSNNEVGNLRWGTGSDNVLDSVRNGTHRQTVKTQCPRGHLLEGSNLYERKTETGQVISRRCRECTIVQNRRYAEKKENN